MSKKFSRAISLIVVLVMVCSVFAGCGTKTNAGTETVATSTEAAGTAASTDSSEKSTLKGVTLKFYFPDQKKSKFDDVWKAIAEKTKDTLNVNFDVTFVGWNDYRDKIQLLTASGDTFDAYFDANWCIYNQMVTKGALYDVSQLLPKYAPTYYAKLQELKYLEPCLVGDKMYALPWTNGKPLREYFIYRADLAEKYNVDMASVKTLEELEPYLKAIKDNEPELLPTWWPKGSGANNFSGVYLALMTKYELDQVSNGLVYSLNDPTCKLMPFEQTEAFKEGTAIIKKWMDAGYISKNMGSMEQKDHFKANTSASWWHELDSAVSVFSFDGAPEGKNAGVNLYPDKKYRLDSPLGNIMAINKNAANPDRVVMFIEEVSKNNEIHDMVVYGIEGETYVLDGNSVKYPEGMDASTSTYLDWTGQWAFWRSGFIRPSDTRPQGYWDANNAALADPTNVMPKLIAFTPVTDNIKTEGAKRDAIADELLRIIELGLEKDVDKAINEYIEKQKAAGVDKMITEIQAQIDEFIK